MSDLAHKSTSKVASPHKASAITRATLAFALAAIIYVGLIFGLPANTVTTHQYHLTPLAYHFLYFAVALPVIGVWYAAFFGFEQLSLYSRRIARTTEGGSFNRFTLGLGWLAWGLPVPSIITITLNAIANKHPAFHSTAIIISNYLSLLLPLIAFSIISQAARGFYSLTPKRKNSLSIRLIFILFAIVSVVFCYLIFRNVDLTSLANTNNRYFLPVWVLMFTIIVPYLYAWFIGALACYEIIAYARDVGGLLYRQPLRLVASGLVAVLIGLIALQYINAVLPAVGHLVLNYKLLLTTIFRVVGGIGYIMIAVGANRLKKIEDV